MLFLWLYVIYVPNPPIPMTDPLKEKEVTFDVGLIGGGGFEIPGGGSSPSMGPGVNGAAQNNPTNGNPGSDDGTTSPDGVDMGAQGSPTATQPHTQPVPQASNALQNLLNHSHGDNSSSTVDPNGGGVNGPVGPPGGGTGTTPGGGPPGPGGHGNGPGVGPWDHNRQEICHPKFSNPTQEEGIVKVSIIVDKDGKVTDASVIVDGSTTQNPELLAIARQCAKQHCFSASKDGSIQITTITFKFALQ